jgi:hypothetical protein
MEGEDEKGRRRVWRQMIQRTRNRKRKQKAVSDSEKTTKGQSADCVQGSGVVEKRCGRRVVTEEENDDGERLKRG